jgi:hypothetical protein
MAVRSTSARQHKASAIVSRATLDRQRGAVERWSALVVLVIGVLGTVVAFHGGWAPVLALHISTAALVGGLAVQGLLTYLEWYYHDLLLVAWSARVIDATLTAIGYSGLLVAPLAELLHGRGVDLAGSVSWVIVWLVSLLIAWYPESRLVDSGGSHAEPTARTDR